MLFAWDSPFNTWAGHSLNSFVLCMHRMKDHPSWRRGPGIYFSPWEVSTPPSYTGETAGPWCCLKQVSPRSQTQNSTLRLCGIYLGPPSATHRIKTKFLMRFLILDWRSQNPSMFRRSVSGQSVTCISDIWHSTLSWNVKIFIFLSLTM